MVFNSQEARKLIIDCLRLIQTNPAKILERIPYDEDRDDLNRRINRKTNFEINKAGRLILEKILPEQILARIRCRSIISIDQEDEKTGLPPTYVHKELSKDPIDDIEDALFIKKVLDSIKDPIDKQIMRLQFISNRPMSLREIAGIVGVSHEDVRKRSRKIARQTMRKFMNDED